MHFVSILVTVLSVYWLAVHTLADIMGIWAGDFNWVEKCITLFAAICFAVKNHGQRAAAEIATFMDWLGGALLKSAAFFRKCSKALSDFFISDDILHRNTQRIDNSFVVGPIKKEFLETNRGSSLRPLTTAVTVAIAVIFFGFFLNLILTFFPEPKVENADANSGILIARKSNRQEIPSTFADRFIVPNEIPGTGGP